MRRLLLVLFVLLGAFPLLAHEPERLTIESKVMGETRTAIVHLPASYGAGRHRYPVIYLTDGPSQAAHTAATIKALVDVGRMPELIVVGVTNTDRTRDLTPTRLANFPTSGGSAKFISFFETELIPEIEKRYRTEPYRIFAGHSFGGLFALETLFTKPKLFNAIVSVSPTVWWDEKYPLKRAKEFVAANRELSGSLILAIGDEGPQMNGSFDELKAFFKKKTPKGFEVESYYFADDDHTSVPVPAHYAALRKLFAPWHFRFDADAKTLWPRAIAHAQELTKRYGFTVRVPEDRANRIGYTLVAAKQVQEAIEVFRANVAAYPASPNVYDSLGEAYAVAGDFEKARVNFAKAVELAKAANDPRTEIFQQHLFGVRRR